MRGSTYWLLGGLAAAAGLYAWSRTSAGSSAIASAVDTVSNLGTPRGIRDNNPGNIERTSIAWQGELTPEQVAELGLVWDPTYVQFTDPSKGVRAIGHVLLAKQARGLNTVDAIIRDYSSTDQDAYVRDVSAALGVSPYDQLDVTARLADLALAIIQQENGEQPYDPNQVAQWVYT